MKKMIMVLAFIATASRLPAAEPEAFAGSIKQIDGPGPVCISNTATKNVMCLSPKQARYKDVFQYDQLWCGPGSTATLTLRWGTKWTISSNAWVQVPLELNPGDADPQVHANMLILEALKPANRSRGDGVLPVFQPANKSAIRLGNSFVVRWVPTTVSMQLELELSSPVSTIAFQTNLDAMLGRVELADILLQLKDEQRKGNLEFILSCKLGARPVRNLKFNILSEAEEKKVDSALAEIPPGFPDFHLARAAVLNQFHLYNGAEDEYDQALNATGNQESIELLERLKEINEQIGNTVKAGEIERRLKTPGPEH